jgi:hypothetical protein
MDDLKRALSDIAEIRGQIVASTSFRGLGPAALLTTAALAVAVAAGQSLWLPEPGAEPLAFFGDWIATGVASVAIIGIEMLRRARRLHSGLADDMILNAAQQFLPSLVAGGFLALVLAWFAPETLWLLPGMWQVLVGVGIFAFARALAGPMYLVAAWYFVAGFAVLMMTAISHTVSPWMMGVPFGAGQVLMALIVHLTAGGRRGGE